jgi:hypothetical protein
MKRTPSVKIRPQKKARELTDAPGLKRKKARKRLLSGPSSLLSLFDSD